jgi:universal stress protein E
MTLRRILVVLDPTAHAQPALDKAASLAARTGAELTLFACDPDPARIRELGPADRDSARAYSLAARRDWLEAQAASWERSGVPCALEVECRSPLHECILARLAAAPPDLVVKDTHPHSLLKRTLLTHTDWQLIRGTSVPLLLVRPDPWAAVPLFVAAIDPGHSGDRTDALDRELLAWARLLAHATDGRAAALNLCFPPSLLAGAADAAMLGWVPAAANARLVEADRLARIEQLRPLVATAGLEPGALHVVIGTPEALPIELEVLRADVAVMGAVSRSPLRRLALGSTAEHVLDRLPCDLLVVKPPDFAANLPS